MTASASEFTKSAAASTITNPKLPLRCVALNVQAFVPPTPSSEILIWVSASNDRASSNPLLENATNKAMCCPTVTGSIVMTEVSPDAITPPMPEFSMVISVGGGGEGLIDADGDTEADTDGLTLADTLLEGLTLALGLTEADGETLALALELGETEADGETDGETLDDSVWKTMSSVNSTHGLRTAVVVSFSGASVALLSPKFIDANRLPLLEGSKYPISMISRSPASIEASENPNTKSSTPSAKRRFRNEVVAAMPPAPSDDTALISVTTPPDDTLATRMAGTQTWVSEPNIWIWPLNEPLRVCASSAELMP